MRTLLALLTVFICSGRLHAQPLQITASSPAHGEAGVPLSTDLRFTFDRAITLPEASLIHCRGEFAEGGHPYEQPSSLSSDGTTIIFQARHLPDRDYACTVYAGPEWLEWDDPQPVIPYAVTYTTASSLGEGSISGSITAVTDDGTSGGSTGQYAVIEVEGESGRLLGSGVADLSVGTYRVDYLRAGAYRVGASQFTADVDGTAFHLALYDPDDDMQRDTVAVLGDVTGIDLVLRPETAYVLPYAEAEARLEPLVREVLPASDAELVGIIAWSPAFDGRGAFWELYYYSVSQSTLATATWQVADARVRTEPVTIEMPLRPIPQSMRDPVAALDLLRSDARTEAFLIAHPVDPYPESFEGGHLAGGDYQFSFRVGGSPYPERMVWRADYSALGQYGPAILSSYVDVETGEILEMQLDPDPAGTATDPNPLPQDLARLLPPYPNPFENVATVPFTASKASDVKITVFDVTGRAVARLFDGTVSPGRHVVSWRAINLASGVYFVRMVTAGSVHFQRLVLQR